MRERRPNWMVVMATAGVIVASVLFLMSVDDLQTVVTGGLALLAFAVAMASYISGPDWPELTRDLSAIRQAVERRADQGAAAPSTRQPSKEEGSPRRLWLIALALMALACVRRRCK